jgi:Zn-dependent protease with chaperone function/type II secretory pathway pseudopilin PulG
VQQIPLLPISGKAWSGARVMMWLLHQEDKYMDLVYKHENALFVISAVLSLLIWLVLLIGTVGMVLIYVVFAYVIYLFVRSAFISYIKGTGVRLSSKQFPDLFERLQACSKTLGLERVPETYILNANGLLNAFATKFLRTHYVVLYSDVADTLRGHPASLNFYIGHELGHIKRAHLRWSPFLWPSSFFPLLGAAYSRAREYTCDRHGMACCENGIEAEYGLAVLAVGTYQWDNLNTEDYAAQSRETGGFWMSLHELTGTYPWLCKRMGQIRAIGKRRKPEYPRRNFFAWLLAAFVPNTGVNAGGGASFLIVVAMIGILAAVALPAYQDYIKTANMTKVVSHYEEAASLARAAYVKGHTQEALGLANSAPNDATSWVLLFDRGGSLAPGGGNAYLANDVGGDATTGAIGVMSTSQASVTIVRPAYVDLTAETTTVIAQEQRPSE